MTNPEKDQIFIYNTEQLSLIKNTFAENDVLLYTVRKVLLQFPLTDAEKNLLKLSITPDVLNALRVRILPELSPTYPLGQIPSILTTLTQELKVKDVEEMNPQFEAKLLEQQYLEQQFRVLENGGEGEQPIKLNELAQLGEKAPYKRFVDMTAYLFLLGYIDPMLLFIKSIAGTKSETPEQQKTRLRRDSAK